MSVLTAWALQFESVCKKLSQRIGILSGICGLFPKNIPVQLSMRWYYHIWIFAAQCGVALQIKSAQSESLTPKTCARIILQCRITDIFSIEMLDKLKWMPFDARVNFKKKYFDLQVYSWFDT